MRCFPTPPPVVDRAWIEKYDTHLVVRGDDFTQEQMECYYWVPMKMGILRTVPYTQGISTSEIIRRIIERQVEN